MTLALIESHGERPTRLGALLVRVTTTQAEMAHDTESQARRRIDAYVGRATHAYTNARTHTNSHDAHKRHPFSCKPRGQTRMLKDVSFRN